jgi:hypothetical protein
MKKITAKEFLEMIAENPSIFEHWEPPLEITGYVYCYNSPITHLSPHLIFSGKNTNGDTADFRYCANLQIASGTFHGYVGFSESRIKKIEKLLVKGTDKLGNSAGFSDCKSLKSASGNFAGSVNFSGSSIKGIRKLRIGTANTIGIYAYFQKCPNLKTLENWDLYKKIDIEPYKFEEEEKRRKPENLAAEKERKALQKFHRKTKPKPLPFL